MAAAFQANRTPTGYLVDVDGKIASELAMGSEAVLQLLDGITETRKQTAEMNPSQIEAAAGNGSLARSKINRDGLKAGTPARTSVCRVWTVGGTSRWRIFVDAPCCWYFQARTAAPATRWRRTLKSSIATTRISRS